MTGVSRKDQLWQRDTAYGQGQYISKVSPEVVKVDYKKKKKAPGCYLLCLFKRCFMVYVLSANNTKSNKVDYDVFYFLILIY